MFISTIFLTAAVITAGCSMSELQRLSEKPTKKRHKKARNFYLPCFCFSLGQVDKQGEIKYNKHP